jgi:hypothetical protein
LVYSDHFERECGLLSGLLGSDATIDARLDMAGTEHSLSRSDSENAECRPYPGPAIVEVVEQQTIPQAGPPGSNP